MMRVFFDELGDGLGWQPRECLAMLWGYFDESGEHHSRENGGGLKRLTVAGARAPRDAWQDFNAVWNSRVIGDFRIPMFHMADFESWAPPFNFTNQDGSRDTGRHNALLDVVLTVMLAHLNEAIGFVAEPSRTKGGAFPSAYEDNIAKLTKEAAIETFHSNVPVTCVFARHKEFKAERIGRYFDLWDDGDDRLKFGGVGDPIDLPPLQAADVIAYEFSRWTRDQKPENDRYPLRRLKEGLRLKGASARFLLNYVL